MTKQEKVSVLLHEVQEGSVSVYEARLQLQRLGVVIKVDRDSMPLFYCSINMDKVALSGRTAFIEVPELEKAGFVAVEPLIKEKRNDWMH